MYKSDIVNTWLPNEFLPRTLATPAATLNQIVDNAILCPICKKLYVNEKGLREHLKVFENREKEHVPDPEYFKTLICPCHNRKFKNRHDLITHLLYEKKKDTPESKEKYKNWAKNWYLKNDGKEYYNIRYRSYGWKYQVKNRKRLNEYYRLWRINNPEDFKLISQAYTNNHRKLSNLFSKLTKKVIQQTYERNINKYKTLTCELCFKPVSFGEDSLEHFIPLNRYKEFPDKDLNALDNLGVAHRRCNYSKSDKTLTEWFVLHSEYLRSLNV